MLQEWEDELVMLGEESTKAVQQALKSREDDDDRVMKAQFVSDLHELRVWAKTELSAFRDAVGLCAEDVADLSDTELPALLEQVTTAAAAAAHPVVPNCGGGAVAIRGGGGGGGGGDSDDNGDSGGDSDDYGDEDGHDDVGQHLGVSTDAGGGDDDDDDDDDDDEDDDDDDGSESHDDISEDDDGHVFQVIRLWALQQTGSIRELIVKAEEEVRRVEDLASSQASEGDALRRNLAQAEGEKEVMIKELEEARASIAELTREAREKDEALKIQDHAAESGTVLTRERDAAIKEARNLRSDLDRCLFERDAAIEEARNLRNDLDRCLVERDAAIDAVASLSVDSAIDSLALPSTSSAVERLLAASPGLTSKASAATSPSRGLQSTDAATSPSRGLQSADAATSPSRGLQSTDAATSPSRGLQSTDAATSPSRGLQSADAGTSHALVATEAVTEGGAELSPCTPSGARQRAGEGQAGARRDDDGGEDSEEVMALVRSLTMVLRGNGARGAGGDAHPSSLVSPPAGGGGGFFSLTGIAASPTTPESEAASAQSTGDGPSIGEVMSLVEVLEGCSSTIEAKEWEVLRLGMRVKHLESAREGELAAANQQVLGLSDELASANQQVLGLQDELTSARAELESSLAATRKKPSPPWGDAAILADDLRQLLAEADSLQSSLRAEEDPFVGSSSIVGTGSPSKARIVEERDRCSPASINRFINPLIGVRDDWMTTCVLHEKMTLSK